MYLLLDIGNTRCKAALYTNDTLAVVPDLFTLDINHTDIKAVVVASVASDDKIETIKKQLGLTTVRWLQVQSERKAFGVTNSYNIPNKLGIDRWLAMIAAKQRFVDKTVLVVDAGTAVTIDWLDQDGCHQGGWILPGVTMQQHAVVRNTAKVLNINELTAQNSAVLAPANNTMCAVQAGSLAAVIGAIKLAWQINPVQKIILTGGDSVLLAQHLDALPIIIEPLLVFHGLRRYCQM